MAQIVAKSQQLQENPPIVDIIAPLVRHPRNRALSERFITS